MSMMGWKDGPVNDKEIDGEAFSREALQYFSSIF